MNIKRHKSELEKNLRAHFRAISLTNPQAPALPQTAHRLLADFVCRGGKRLRPLLFMQAAADFGRPADTAIRQMALAIELLHQFALIHDDIVDRANQRHELPSLHCRFNSLSDKARLIGPDLALITGDWLLVHALRLVAVLPEPARVKNRLIQLMLETAETTAAGQLEELCAAVGLCRIDVGRVMEVFAAKTACYSFACPLLAAAIMAGRPKKILPLLARAGRLLGQAYQIKDDLADFLPGTGVNPHLHATLPYLLLIEHEGKKWTKPPALHILRAKMQKHDIDRQCQMIIRKLSTEGYALLAEAGLPNCTIRNRIF